MGEVRFMISEAAKQVKVESHVLRYWEEELDLEIGRTEMGHRYYTKDDIQLFRCIKKLKDEGMLLKDLKPIIPELKETRLKLQSSGEPKTGDVKKSVKNEETQHVKAQTESKSIKPDQAASASSSQTRPSSQDKPADQDSTLHSSSTAPEGSVVQKKTAVLKDSAVPDRSAVQKNAEITESSKEQNNSATLDKPSQDKPALQRTPSSEDAFAVLSIAQAEVIPVTQLEQVRTLIGDVLTEVVTANNEDLKKEISQTVTKDVMREMDFLFQAKERQEEEHFRKLDCLIRQQQASRREAAKEGPMGKLKKLLT
jgi:DNA-binding transcriptional MerR regulator